MAQIFYRAQYTAPVPGTITDGFTLTLSSGFTAVDDGVRGHFVIIDEDNPAMFANVIGTVTGGNNLKVNRVEFDGTKSDGVPAITNALPAFTGTVKIMSSLPLSQYSGDLSEGLDGILIMGDYNALGHNGAPHNSITYGTSGYHPVLDTPDPNVLMWRTGQQIVKEDHTGLEATGDALLINTFTPAIDPLPIPNQTGNNGLFSPINGVGFATTFGKEYYHRLPGSRRCCLINYVGDTKLMAAHSGTGSNGVGIVNSFIGYDPDNNDVKVMILCVGMADVIAGTDSGAFQTSLDGVISNHRVTSPTMPVIMCAMPSASISALGGTAINNVILDTPNRFACVSIATPGAYTMDATNKYIDAPGQRAFGKVIFEALETALDNQIL